MSPPLLATLRDDECQPQTARPDPAVAGDLIRLENITKTYHLGEVDVPVLKGVSLRIARGEMVALMGASGSGKTTLMNILGCLDRPSSGRFWFDGQEMSRLSPNQRALVRTSKLGFVFQSFNLLPRTSALHNVIMPLDYALRRPARSESKRLAAGLLKQLGLATHVDREPSQMSGGQQQRVAIARALVNRPALLLADEPTGNLDSHTGEEILRMFQRLNAQGITVVLVTHDPKVAAYADRTIHIADGLIADGRGGHHVPMVGLRVRPADAEQAGAGIAAESGLETESDARPARRQPFTWRSLSATASSLLPPTLRTALNNLRRNKLRSALTALGVIIGVAAVIAMTEIGQGSKAEVEKMIASMGAYKLIIFPWAVNNSGVSQGLGTAQSLKPADVDEIRRQCPDVALVVPMVWAKAQVIYGNRNWVPQQMTGTGPDYLATRDWEDLVEGNNFSDDDVRKSNCVCLIGQTVKRELFEDESPVGKTIRIRNVPFRVIGLLSPRGGNMMGQDQDDNIVAPWTTVKFRVNSVGAGSVNAAAAALAATINTLNKPYVAATPLYPQALPIELNDMPQAMRQTSIDFVQAKAASAEQVPAAIEEIETLLRERHRLTGDKEDDFRIIDLTEIAHANARTGELMSLLLLVVASISLVVGGVGIMNIMLVSVTERTREIGLRMAVGARRFHILQQFLVEAVLLCLAGGALGILFGRGASILVREFQHWPTGISMTAIVASVLVAAGVGIVFGFYPAWKASRLDPIEALRHE